MLLKCALSNHAKVQQDSVLLGKMFEQKVGLERGARALRHKKAAGPKYDDQWGGLIESRECFG